MGPLRGAGTRFAFLVRAGWGGPESAKGGGTIDALREIGPIDDRSESARCARIPSGRHGASAP